MRNIFCKENKWKGEKWKTAAEDSGYARYLVVCYTAVFSVVTCRHLRDDTKNGCVAD